MALVQGCWNRAPECMPLRYRGNVWLNDIFVFGMLLKADAHGDSFFHVELRLGMFAVAGEEPWGAGPGGYVWGHRKDRYLPANFPPSSHADHIITDFNILHFVFHHFGVHRVGG